jgi:hypothetical protein
MTTEPKHKGQPFFFKKKKQKNKECKALAIRRHERAKIEPNVVGLSDHEKNLAHMLFGLGLGQLKVTRA